MRLRHGAPDTRTPMNSSANQVASSPLSVTAGFGSGRVTCIKCKHAKVSATEVNCQHWHHPGRSMARDLRYERSPMLHVTGMEWAKRCVDFKPNGGDVERRGQ